LFTKIYVKLCLNDQGDKTMSGYIKYEVHVYASGNKFWYLNEQLHREDGPAIEYADGRKCWCLDGVEYTKSEYKAEMERRKDTCNGKIVTIEGKQYELTEIK
jgi:hypothetical protein